MAHTVMTALFEKPAKAWSESTRPVIASAASTSRATRSILITSLMNRISDTTRMPRTSAISKLMLRKNTLRFGVQYA